MATRAGRLLGYGLGQPPLWCSTAAAAEAWALQTVIGICPFPPAVRTDCQALLHMATAGTQQATKASRPLARIWRRIADTLGTDISMLMTTGLLVWLPAHLSHDAVGEVKLSDGSRLTPVDWRANRLADKLAQVAAGTRAEPKHVVDLLESFDAASAYAAALLGVVTHAANNHNVTEVDEAGNLVTRTKRDSMAKPGHKRPQGPRPMPAPPAPARAQSAAPKLCAPWRPPKEETAAARKRREQQEAVNRRVEAIGCSLRPRPGTPTLSAVQERIRARIAANSEGA